MIVTFKVHEKKSLSVIVLDTHFQEFPGKKKLLHISPDNVCMFGCHIIRN